MNRLARISIWPSILVQYSHGVKRLLLATVEIRRLDSKSRLGSMSEIEIYHQLTPTNTECNASASGMLAPATISGLLPSVAERPHSLTVGTVDRL